MKILVAIGNFFRRIWKWIVETAWVQPLLIVGIIFGIIFSIPAISEAIEKASASSGEGNFYKRHRLSDKEIEGLINGNSEIISDLDDKNNRFLVVVVAEDCINCHDNEEGFKDFFNGEMLFRDKNEEVMLHTIYTVNDEDDSRYEVYEKFDDTQTEIIHETFVTFMDTLGRSEEDIKSGEDTIADGIPTPTLILYENGTPIAVSFGVQADSTNATVQARYIDDFYFEKGTFDPTK